MVMMNGERLLWTDGDGGEYGTRVRLDRQICSLVPKVSRLDRVNGDVLEPYRGETYLAETGRSSKHPVESENL